MAVKKITLAIKDQPKHLLGIQNLSVHEAKDILEEAKTFIKLNRSSSKKSDILRGKTQITIHKNAKFF
jgi:aspartate carbamoyltransferase catalytic subunit